MTPIYKRAELLQKKLLWNNWSMFQARFSHVSCSICTCEQLVSTQHPEQVGFTPKGYTIDRILGISVLMIMMIPDGVRISLVYRVLSKCGFLAGAELCARSWATVTSILSKSEYLLGYFLIKKQYLPRTVLQNEVHRSLLNCVNM